MSLSRLTRCSSLIGVICYILLGCKVAAGLPPSNSDADEVRNEIAQYYAHMVCKDGLMVPAFASHFWPGATITTVWRPKTADKLQVTITSIPDFVAQSSDGACSQPIFDERMEGAEIKIHNGLAQVWTHYRARFGKPGHTQQWSGIDAFTLLKYDGRWKIVSLAFRADPGGP